MSLRARLLVTLAALAVAGLLVADVVTYAALRSFFIERVDGTLAANAGGLRDTPLGAPWKDHGLQVRFDKLSELPAGTYVERRDEAGRVVDSTVYGPGSDGPVPELPDPLPAPAPGEAHVMTVGSRGDGPDFRVRVEWQRFGGLLVVAAPLDDVAATLRRLVAIMAIVSAAVVAGIVALGAWLVRVGLRPLRRIEDTAAAIAAGDLGRRIETTTPRTEVGRLGRALNAMLGQIEAAFSQRAASERRLRRFVADASHELRTPLSAVQAYAELFDRGARHRPEDLERAMAGIGRESRRMGKLVDELLLLARLDQGRPLQRIGVDIAGLAREAVDAARALEPSRPLAVSAPDALTIEGDPDRLRQVLDNLLANVRAHTPAGAPATVRVTREQAGSPDAAGPPPAEAFGSSGRGAGVAVIEVADTGPGIGDEHAARVFERFYRADPARARDRAGAGLGLAIVAAVVEAHGGRATATSDRRGARFRIELPLRGAGGGHRRRSRRQVELARPPGPPEDL